jgi:hypothetical protein
LRFMVLVINGMVLFHHLIVYKFSVANLVSSETRTLLRAGSLPRDRACPCVTAPRLV